jgi:hypothetical protein
VPSLLGPFFFPLLVPTMMKVVVFFCFLWLCVLFVGDCQEKTEHTFKEHLFSVFPLSNQPGGCLVQHPGYPDIASLVSDFY